MVQLPFGARVGGQLLVAEKSLLAAMVPTLIAPVPVLVSVTGFGALVVPAIWPGKVRLAGEKLATGAVPVPLNPVVCGPPKALSFTVSVPARVPVAVGVNVTWIEQLPPEPRLAGQLLLWLKSPLVVMLLMFSAPRPILVRVAVCGLLLVPVFCAAKVSVAGNSVTLTTLSAAEPAWVKPVPAPEAVTV